MEESPKLLRSSLSSSSSSTSGEYRPTNQTAHMQESAEETDTMQKVAGVAFVMLLASGIGALSAWAFTSIPPLGGALLTAVPIVGLVTGGEIHGYLAKDKDFDENQDNALKGKIFLGTLVATAVTVNLVGVLLFPYLGMTALSVTKTTLFTLGSTIAFVTIMNVLKK